MKRNWTIGLVTASLTIAGIAGIAAEQQDKYALKVPGGLGFSEFKGYESWQMISVSRQAAKSGDSRGDGSFAVILGNPAMIDALQSGIPDNGKPFPDGAKMAKMHYAQAALEQFPTAMVASDQLDIDFMVKDSARFADGGGWGYAAFKYDAAASAFRPFTTQDMPPQANDAKCGVACHTIAKPRDYVFTRYVTR